MERDPIQHVPDGLQPATSSEPSGQNPVNRDAPHAHGLLGRMTYYGGVVGISRLLPKGLTRDPPPLDYRASPHFPGIRALCAIVRWRPLGLQRAIANLNTRSSSSALRGLTPTQVSFQVEFEKSKPYESRGIPRLRVREKGCPNDLTKYVKRWARFALEAS